MVTGPADAEPAMASTGVPPAGTVTAPTASSQFFSLEELQHPDSLPPDVDRNKREVRRHGTPRAGSCVIVV